MNGSLYIAALLVVSVECVISGCPSINNGDKEKFVHSGRNNPYFHIPVDKDSTILMLKMPFNKIPAINLELQHYPLLESIILSHNNISVISDLAFINQTNLKCLDLRDNKLTEYPNLDSCAHTMTSLDLKRNNLTRIKIGFFASFNKLADLTLDNNMISRVTKTRMRGLFNLKELSLADNQIRAIKCDTFDESPKLNVLNLGRNQLSALPCIRSPPGNWSLRTLILAGNNLTDGHNASVAAYLKNVRTLDISNNNLKELTNFTTEMPSLQLLWLNGNSHLRFDPTDFANSENLTWVKYADSNLQRAPLFGKAKSSMDYLDLGKNNIKCIDIDHISNMQNVTLLNFTENNLNMFPDIGCLTTLSSSNINDITFPRLGEIILTHNQIYQFPLLPGMPLESIIRLQHNELIEFPPERLALLTKVGILQMQYNNATQFPDFSYASTYSMTDLDLSHNNISSVPSGNIAPLVSLTHLRLQYNYISDLPIMEFAHNTLKYLYLSHNLIHQLDPMILPPKTLLALTHLYVSYNFISQVPKALFGQLHSLIYLDISYNILETMPCVSGVGPTLQTLLLRHNNLTHVPAKCVEGLSGLEKLDLSYNLIVDFPFWMMVDGYFPSLIKLNISSNLISHIPSLDSQKILQTLRMDVTSNYLNCTHRLCWLKSFQRFTLNRDDKLCAFPPRFAGLAFADISDVDLGCHYTIKIAWDTGLTRGFIAKHKEIPADLDKTILTVSCVEDCLIRCRADAKCKSVVADEGLLMADHPNEDASYTCWLVHTDF